ncbi:CpxP family protein [Vibrio sp.]|uniref:CpxP family protein n=1 Tax=Vibrio sp. TaxID=678 RepID=UPI003D140EF6
MKTKNKWLLAAMIAPVALMTAGVANAYGGKGHHQGFHDGPCGGGYERGVWKDLELTDQQQEQLKTLRSERREQMQQQFAANRAERQAQMQAHHAQMQQLMLADTFDQAAATELARELVEQQTERRVAMMAQRHKMLSVLTAEQKAKFAELSQQRMQQCSEIQPRWNKSK